MFPRVDASALVRDLKLGDRLNEGAGRLIANREGIPVILAGTIERRGQGYNISVRALSAEQQEPLTVAEASASGKGDVLGAVGRVAEQVRTALGDTTPSARQQAETFTAGSLEAVKAYTTAQDLSSAQRDTEAIVKYPRSTPARP